MEDISEGVNPMSRTKPELLVTKPIYAPTMTGLERDFTVHKLWTAPEPAAFLKKISFPMAIPRRRCIWIISTR